MPGIAPAPDRVLTADDIEALALGAWILGTGGGGSPYLNLLNMRELYAAGHTATLRDPLALADDALVAVLSNQGAPLINQERLSNPRVALRALRTLEAYIGRRFEAVMPVEIGGGNGVYPLMVAALTGLPAIDADAMGRAYPEAQMTSFAVAGLQCYPLAMADIRDNDIVIPRAASWKWMERISRRICVEMGSSAATCKAPRTGREVKDHAILHTTTKAIALGRAVREAQRRHHDPIAVILRECGGKRLFAGKVADLERRTTEGFLRGRARLDGLDGERGETFTLDFQNEFSVGRRGETPVVTTPDLICVIDSDTGEGIGTDALRFGQRVTVLALPAPEVFRSAAGIALVGPRAFGFDFDYRSAFEDASA
ncbi:conserved hypothetical protein [uncultured Alphaproteobacteria bacterium]|uniref:DUF917 domain-containing protein n=1 Tax=uncultured Alphaproteobacteria bacterium TaxID=91750 RepID=A0A212JI61_9PROT|nr:conserved hypothetical protein [uncultured Alphaproteobacteria bacterium]